MVLELAPNPKASLFGGGCAVFSGTLLHRSPSQQSNEQSVNMPVPLTNLQTVTRRTKDFQLAISEHFPLCLKNKYWCTTFHMKMSLNCKEMNVH